MTATVTSVGGRSSSALAAPIACGCCLLAGAAYVGLNDPSAGGGFLPCPFRTLTGWWCPGCGLTRAAHHLMRGDLGRALHFNAFVVVILAGLLATWLVWLLHCTGRRVAWVRTIPVLAQAASIAVLVAFAVVRNLPGVEGLRG
jgi:hypothetical protein